MIARLNQGWVTEQIQRQLGPGVDGAAFVRSVITAIGNAPDLARCTPDSVYGAMFLAAQLRLQIGGGLGQSYIIPRTDRNSPTGWSASLQLGYPGLLKLAYNTAQITNVDTIVVREGDRFRKGANSERGKFFDLQFGEHADDPEAKVLGIIALMWVRGGTKPVWRYMTREQIEARRPDYTKTDRHKGPWATDWTPMGEKTVLRELLKFAPKSAELALAMTADEAESVTRNNAGELAIKQAGIPGIETAQPRPAEQPQQAQPAQPAVEPTMPDVDPDADYDAPPEDFWGDKA